MSGVTLKYCAANGAEMTKAGNHFIKNQQQTVLVANRTQFFQIAFRWNQYAGGARHRLDNHTRDGGGVVQRNEVFQSIGQMCAPLGLPAAERRMFRC